MEETEGSLISSLTDKQLCGHGCKEQIACNTSIAVQAAATIMSIMYSVYVYILQNLP